MGTQPEAGPERGQSARSRREVGPTGRTSCPARNDPCSDRPSAATTGSTRVSAGQTIVGSFARLLGLYTGESGAVPHSYLPLDGNVTVLYGRNGAGKSYVLDCMRSC